MVMITQTSFTSIALADDVVPFKIQVPDAVLEDLKHRLEQARFADEIPDANWDYGTNAAYLKALVSYWRDIYDWRAQERRLNQFDQFKTSIDGMDVHFILSVPSSRTRRRCCCSTAGRVRSWNTRR